MEEKDFDYDEMMDEVDDFINDSDNDTIMFDIKEWFNNSFYRPDAFEKNSISDVYDKNGYVHMKHDIRADDNTLMLCTATIKDLGYPIISFEKYYDSSPDAESLFLYGHELDFRDDYKSRFDETLVDLICADINTKFKNIYVYGAFESVQSMRDTISELYRRLIDPEKNGSVVINLESKVLDDENNVRTVANMLSTNYIQSVLTNLMPVKFMYKKFPKRLTARLFTGCVEMAVGEQTTLKI